MLSQCEAELVRRYEELPGLAVLLDPDALIDVLDTIAPQFGVRRIHAEYLRFKPGTSCICAYDGIGSSGPLRLYAKAFHGRSREKLRYWCAGLSGSTRLTRAASLPWQLGISAYPDDRRMRDLHRLHDETVGNRLLAAVIPGFSRWNSPRVETLRYKPERRYVASVWRGDEPTVLVKMYDQRGFFAARARARLFERCRHLRVPALLGDAPRSGLLAFEWVRGTSLDELLLEGDLEAFASAGEALAGLHSHPFESSLPVTRSSEGSVRAAAEGVESVSPSLGDRARGLTDQLARRLASTGAELKFTHGDFNPEQVVVQRGGATIVDYDRASVGDPAADLGSFIAYLERSVLRGGLSAPRAAELADALTDGYGRMLVPPSPASVRLHTAAALLRLAPEPFRRREPEWISTTSAILDRCTELCVTRPAAGQGRRKPSPPPAVRVLDPYSLGTDPDWEFLWPALDPCQIGPLLAGSIAALGESAAGYALREIRVTRCKPRRRCIVEYEFHSVSFASEPLVVIGKARMKGADIRGYYALERLWSAGFRPDAGRVCVPQPAGVLHSLRMVLQRKVPGRDAGEELLRPGSAGVARRIAEAIHDIHMGARPPFRRHTAADELRILGERLPSVIGEVTDGVRRIPQLLALCEKLAEHLEPVQPRPIHRDFYPDHVLIDDDRVWLIDLDLHCVGDPALDVGNFVAHLIEQGVRVASCSAAAGIAAAAFRSRYAELAGAAVLPSVDAYTTLSLARHVHLSTQFPARHHTTEPLLALCERRLAAPATMGKS